MPKKRMVLAPGDGVLGDAADWDVVAADAGDWAAGDVLSGAADGGIEVARSGALWHAVKKAMIVKVMTRGMTAREVTVIFT